MTEEILKVEHLNKFYGDWQALHDISFNLKKGEVLAILGPSGSGKSTLLRTLNGLENYKNGEIVFHGKKVQSSPKEWLNLDEEECEKYMFGDPEIEHDQNGMLNVKIWKL